MLLSLHQLYIVSPCFPLISFD